MYENKKSQRGFTLIELIIAIAIIGLLAGIAYPSYTESVNRAKRAQAQTAIVSLAQAMERYFTRCNSYNSTTAPCTTSVNAADANAPASTLFSTYVPQNGSFTASTNPATCTPAAGVPMPNYKLTFSAISTSAYTITATRCSSGVMSADTCGDYTFTAAGAKGIANNTGGKTVATCWK